ncbi:hypothetical protein C8R43DRAFT_1012530 [Mycena crocata]|nr:hypothetical protein C8R43DRAFT_1012530 [Mycena crocata]
MRIWHRPENTERALRVFALVFGGFLDSGSLQFQESLTLTDPSVRSKSRDPSRFKFRVPQVFALLIVPMLVSCTHHCDASASFLLCGTPPRHLSYTLPKQIAVWPTLHTMTPTYLSTTHLLPPRPTRTQCPFGNRPDADLCGRRRPPFSDGCGMAMVAFTFDSEAQKIL